MGPLISAPLGGIPERLPPDPDVSHEGHAPGITPAGIVPMK